MIETRITKLLKCRYPILLPGMSWISTPELVAAVSNAGGVGILATGPLSPIETRESIHKIRQLLKPIPIPISSLSEHEHEHEQESISNQSIQQQKQHYLSSSLSESSKVRARTGSMSTSRDRNENNNNNNHNNNTETKTRLPPFGIGATLLMPGATENAQIALEEQVPIINISLGKPDWIANEIHSYGGCLLSTVTNTKHATAAIDCGADALLVTGHEAAAHGGDVTSIVLIPTLSNQFPNIPLIGAGGFANGRGLSAALMLGADAIAMGSRFAVSQESPLHSTIKVAITNHTEMDTIYGSNFDGIPARVLKTSISHQLMSKQPFFGTVLYRAYKAAATMKIPLWKVLPGFITKWNQMYMIAQFGAATQRLELATIHGNLQEGVQFVGQSQGMIHDIPTVNEIIQRTVQEAQQIILEKSRLF